MQSTKIKTLLTNKRYLIVIILIALFLPMAIIRPAESETKSIVVGVGVDTGTGDNKYALSAQIIMPIIETKTMQKVKVVQSQGETMTEAIDKLNLITGKEIGLSHCNVIVIGDELASKGITEPLDYFMRTDKLNINTVLLSTESAYDLLNSFSELDNTIYFTLQNVVNYNDRSIYSANTNLESFYKGLIKKPTSNYMGRVDILTGESGGVLVEGQQSEEASSTSQTEEKKVIANTGRTCLFKNGKKVALLEEDDIKGYNWLDSKSKFGDIKVSGLVSEPYVDGMAVLKIAKKTNSYKVSFDGNTPIYKSKINLLVKVNEIDTVQGNEESFIKVQKSYFNKELEEKAKQILISDIDKSIGIFKEYNVDILGIYDAFNKNMHKQFNEVLNNYDSYDDFFDAVEYEIEINIKPIL